MLQSRLPGQAARGLGRLKDPGEGQQGRPLGLLRGARYNELESLRKSNNVMIGRQSTYIRNNTHIYIRYITWNYYIYHVYVRYISDIFQTYTRNMPTPNFLKRTKHLRQSEHLMNVISLEYTRYIHMINMRYLRYISDISYLSTHVVHMS